MNERVTKLPEHAWLFSSRLENWEQIIRQKSFGTKKRYPLLDEAQPGDPCVAYIPQRKMFVGLGKITSSPYLDRNSPFPNRVHLEMRVDLQQGVRLRTIRANLQFAKDKAAWLAVLNGVFQLPYGDYKVIRSSLEPLLKNKDLVTSTEATVELQRGFEDKNITDHTQAEYALLRLGNLLKDLLGFETFVTPDDGNKECDGKLLSDVATLKELPQFAVKETLEIVRHIDVIWFNKKNFPVYCFEVEHSTDISKALERFSELAGIPVNFVIVAPEIIRDKFDKKIRRPAFPDLKVQFKTYYELGRFLRTADEFVRIKRQFLENH